MLLAIEVLTVVLVAVAVALALAHALELPGKMRLSKEQYAAVQTIYYPGFTFGGAAEPLSVLLLLVLLLFMWRESAAFWLTGGAFLALLLMHAVYWIFTHPVNNFWLKDFELKGLGRRFFAFHPVRQAEGAGSPDWTLLRDRWEFSHVVRAGLGMAGLILLVTAVAGG